MLASSSVEDAGKLARMRRERDGWPEAGSEYQLLLQLQLEAGMRITTCKKGKWTLSPPFSLFPSSPVHSANNETVTDARTSLVCGDG